jgi:hypothetical protein
MDCETSDSKMAEKYGPDWKTDGRVGAILYFNALKGSFKSKR